MDTMTTTHEATDTDAVHERGLLALDLALEELQKLAEAHPKFFLMLDEEALECAPRATFLRLLANAPTAAVRAYVLGKYTSRILVATATGHPFV